MAIFDELPPPLLIPLEGGARRVDEARSFSAPGGGFSGSKAAAPAPRPGKDFDLSIAFGAVALAVELSSMKSLFENMLISGVEVSLVVMVDAAGKADGIGCRMEAELKAFSSALLLMLPSWEAPRVLVGNGGGASMSRDVERDDDWPMESTERSILSAGDRFAEPTFSTF